MNERYWTVSEAVNQVKNVLEAEFRSIQLIGEVSNLSSSASGHWYLTLSDENASLSAAVFRVDALRNSFIKQLKNGDKVLCNGAIGVYTKRGTFQLIVKTILPFGEGQLKARLELLKSKLAAEGLFDPALKKPIPKFPKRVAVITALKGAALQDFVNIYRRRCLWMDVLVSPALVQGNEAPESLRKALFKVIKYHLDADEQNKIDLVVLTRGGGSLEDLWAFNDEALAWDIHHCPIPTISAVGHEVDYSICDYVADLRCETPSAAAEVITSHQVALKEQMNVLRRDLSRYGELLLLSSKDSVERYNPKAVIQRIYENLLAKQKKLRNLEIKERLLSFADLPEKKLWLDDLMDSLSRNLDSKLENSLVGIEQQFAKLSVLNPSSILSRGYSYARMPDGRLIGSKLEFDELNKGENLKIMFYDGEGNVIKA